MHPVVPKSGWVLQRSPRGEGRREGVLLPISPAKPFLAKAGVRGPADAESLRQEVVARVILAGAVVTVG